MLRLGPYLVGAMLALASVSAIAKPPADPPGQVLVSIQMLEGWKPIKRRTGYWLYAESTTGNLAGPLVTGYEYSNGKLVDEFGGGSEPHLAAEIASIGLVSFDFETEVQAAQQRLAETAKSDADLVACGVRDGARWQVTVNTPEGTFKLDAWNPGAMADCLAPVSENLAKLDKLFDLVRKFYAGSKLQF